MVWNPDVVDAYSDIVAASFRGKRPVRRQIISTLVTRGETLFYDIQVLRDGVVFAVARVDFGNPSFYSTPEGYASSNYIVAGADAFKSLATANGIAIVASFPGGYDRVSPLVATASLSIAITGVEFARYKVRTVTNTGVVAFTSPVDEPFDPLFTYELTASGGSGQWIGDLSWMDRSRVLYEFNLEKGGSSTSTLPPGPTAPTPDVGTPPPTTVNPAVGQEELYMQVARIGTQVQMLADSMTQLRLVVAQRGDIYSLEGTAATLVTEVRRLRVDGAKESDLVTVNGNILALGSQLLAGVPSQQQRLLETASVGLALRVLLA